MAARTTKTKISNRAARSCASDRHQSFSDIAVNTTILRNGILGMYVIKPNVCHSWPARCNGAPHGGTSAHRRPLQLNIPIPRRPRRRHPRHKALVSLLHPHQVRRRPRILTSYSTDTLVDVHSLARRVANSSSRTSIMRSNRAFHIIRRLDRNGK